MRTRTTRRDATTLESAETNLRTDYVFRNGATATHVKTWLSRFTADVAGAIESEQPLPSGTWSMAGTSSWTRGANNLGVDGDHEPAVALQRELRRGATVRFRHIDCGGRAGRPDGDREHPVHRLRGVFGQPILIERGVSSSMRPP